MFDRLYLVKREIEEDNGAHWNRTYLMTHDKDAAYDELKRICEGVSIQNVTDCDAFIEEWVYDADKKQYDFLKFIFASPAQMKLNMIKYSDETRAATVSWMKDIASTECCLKGILQMQVFDNVIKKEFDILLKKTPEHAHSDGQFKFTLYSGGENDCKMDCSDRKMNIVCSDANAIFQLVKLNCILRGQLRSDFNDFRSKLIEDSVLTHNKKD